MATAERTYGPNTCKSCGSRSLPVDGGDSVRRCTECHDVLGIEDSIDRSDGSMDATGNDEIRIKLHACTCGNDDVNEFEFRTQGGAICLMCRLCDRIYMTSLAATPAETRSDRNVTFDVDVDDAAAVVDEVVGDTSPVGGAPTCPKADNVDFNFDWSSGLLRDGTTSTSTAREDENVAAARSQPAGGLHYSIF